MKITYKVIMAALAAGISLISCKKEKQDVESASEGPRTIAISFTVPTKTVLGDDGITPNFNSGDEILVSNGGRYQKLYVDVDGSGFASFTTDLSGSLTAVYPAKAAKLDGTEITGVLVPSNQTGRFADANIAMAKISEGASKAYFENQTAILKFYVDASIGVTGINVRSNGDRIADGFIDENGIVIEKDEEFDYTTRITVEQIAEPEANYFQPDYIPLHQLTDDPQGRVCYVAIRPTTGTQTYDLGISSRTLTQSEPLFGTKAKQNGGLVNRLFSGVSLPANTLANVFIPYYIPVNVSKDSKPEYQYWAYCNLGAFLPEETGYYFTWGNTYGYVPKNYEEDEDDVEWFLPSGEPAPAGGFTNDNYTKTQGSKLTGNITAENDAATVALGGKWRMPAKSEFEVLVSATTWTASGWEEIYGKRGKYFVDKDGSRIFLPTTGNVYADEMQYTRQEAHYWSSVLSTEGQNQAYGLYYWGTPSISSTYRYNGCPIRPIYGDPLPEGNGLEVNKYNEGPTL